MNKNLINIKLVFNTKQLKGMNNYTIEACLAFQEEPNHVIIRYELIPAIPIASWFLNISYKGEALEYLSMDNEKVRIFWLALVDKMEAQEQETHSQAIDYINKVLK